MDPLSPKHIFMALTLLLGSIVIVFPYWKIFKRAGFSGWLSLSMIIPLVNLIFLYYLALAQWPRDRTTA